MVISIDIPGVGEFHWTHLVLDVNGTLTTEGALLSGVAWRLRALSSQVAVHLLTADTRGTASTLAKDLGVAWERVQQGGEAERKRAYEALGADRVIAVGNGNNDARMLSTASLGIAVMGPEGTAVKALLAADVVVRDVADGLDLLLDPIRLLSTLRC